MGTFTLTIDTGNAAFDPEPSSEIARILRKLADDLSDGLPLADPGDYRLPFDANGNPVGTWSYEESDR